MSHSSSPKSIFETYEVRKSSKFCSSPDRIKKSLNLEECKITIKKVIFGDILNWAFSRRSKMILPSKNKQFSNVIEPNKQTF